MRTPKLNEWYKIHDLIIDFSPRTSVQIRKNLQATLEESVGLLVCSEITPSALRERHKDQGSSEKGL